MGDNLELNQKVMEKQIVDLNGRTENIAKAVQEIYSDGKNSKQVQTARLSALDKKVHEGAAW